MKRNLILSLTFIASLGVNAQSKLSSTITDMLNNVQQQIAEARVLPRAQSFGTTSSPTCPVDTIAIKDNMTVSFNEDGSVNTVDVVAELAEGATCPSAMLTSKGIKVNGEALGFVFLTVPADQLNFLETLPEFVSLDADNINKPNNDYSRELLNVSKINGIDNADYTFSTPFTGKGVVVGIIDAGIDYNHVAFKDSEGNTRIKKAVNYSSSSISSQTIVSTPEQIAALTWDNTTSDDHSHGTHVAASAAGSRLSSVVDYTLGSRNLMGMAPEADLVLCGTNNYGDTKVIACMNEIISTANELGEPCVINMSFGNTGGWHTSTTISKAIDKVAKAGVVVCMSTANDAIHNWCVDKTIPTDEYLKIIPTKTLPVASALTSYIPKQTITFFLPNCTDKSKVSYSFEVVDSLSGEVTTLAQTPLKNTNGVIITPTIMFSPDASNNGWVKGTMNITKSYFADNSKFLVIKVQNVSGADLRIYALNSQVADSFASTDFPEYTYDKGTADMSMNNSCCTENIISVGSYTRSRAFKAYNMPEGKQYSFSVKDVGNNNSTSAFSSYGKDDHGKAHPDVIAPGAAISSAYNYYDTKHADASKDNKGTSGHITAYYYDSSTKLNLWKIANGTSMAAPVATGVIALWMQACRELAPEHGDLTTADVREIIVNTSRTSVDGKEIEISAGNTDQNRLQLGNGLIDAEAGIQYIIDNYVATAISGVESGDNATSANIVKKFVDGAIIIEKNGKYYNTAGQNIR